MRLRKKDTEGNDNYSNKHLSSENYVPGAGVNTLHAFVYMILTTTHEGFYYYYLHFICEETQRNQAITQQRLAQDSN